MKIAILTNDLEALNGWSKYGLDLGEEYIKEGHQVVFYVQKQTKLNFDQVVVFKKPALYIGNPTLCFWTARNLNKKLKFFSPDVVHAVVEPYGLVLPFLSRKFKKILTVHGTYAWMPSLLSGIRKQISTFLSRKMFWDVDSVIAVSNYTKDQLLQRSLDQEINRKISVITNGTKIVEQKISKPINKIKKILFVGIIKPRKGLKEMLYGLADYKKNFSSDFVCEIVGKYDNGDKYFIELQQIIFEHNLTHNVVFMGIISKEELKKRYLEADLYLMLPVVASNDFEGFGLVYLEAAARGTPSIGSVNSGAEDAIEGSKSGLLVNPHNPRDISIAINKILNNNAISKDACIAWAESNSIDKKAKQILNLYK